MPAMRFNWTCVPRLLAATDTVDISAVEQWWHDSIPWGWTNLPTPNADLQSASGEFSSVLLSAPALRDLLCFVCESKRDKENND